MQNEILKTICVILLLPKNLFSIKKGTFTDYVLAEFCKERYFQQEFHQSPV